MFDRNIFDPNIFDVGAVQRRGGGGSGGRKVLNRKPDKIELEEIQEIIELPIQRNVEIELKFVDLGVEVRNVEIEVVSSVLLNIPSVLLVIDSGSIEIETSVDYYDRDERIKIIMALAA